MRLPVGKIERTLKVLPGCADILFGGAVMLATRVLLVDGDEVVHMTLAGVLEQSGFAITSAANARESLRLISGAESYDIPGSGSGDALNVVSAMRHANRCAVTLLLNAFPAMTVASFPLRTGEILLKPAGVT